jgi:hypothetical protein
MPYDDHYEYDLIQAKSDDGTARYSVLCHGGDAVTVSHPLDTAFATKVALTENGFLQTEMANGLCTKLLPEKFGVDTLYLPFLRERWAEDSPQSVCH